MVGLRFSDFLGDLTWNDPMAFVTEALNVLQYTCDICKFYPLIYLQHSIIFENWSRLDFKYILSVHVA